MAFTALDVKKLREMTNVGMMDCKKALQETDGDMDKAVDWLREKGLAKAAKKADRVAAMGGAYATVVNGVASSSKSIPKPTLPPRPRRSSTWSKTWRRLLPCRRLRMLRR